MATSDLGQPHPGTKPNPMDKLKPGTLLNPGQSQIQETFEQKARNGTKYIKLAHN